MDDIFKTILSMIYIPEKLRFRCIPGCSKCCRFESGYIFISEYEAKKISEYLDINLDKFYNDYTINVKGLISIKEKQNLDCIFWSAEANNNNGGCKIYKVRPAQCKNYPFWITNFIDRKTYHKEVEYCPGLNDLEGKVYNKDKIIKLLYKDYKQRFKFYNTFLLTKFIKEN